MEITMTPKSSIATARIFPSVRVALAAFAFTVALASQAGAVSLTVKLACANDYYAHCSQHAPGSVGVRKCMRAHGSQLSQRCVSALVAAGEVSKVEVDRRKAVASARRSKTASVD
jgi:hypothetical protein